MSRDSVLLTKSMEFAVRIVNLYKYLLDEKRETVMSKQLLRSGTSVGANIHESVNGQSRKDFLAKLGIALKEASETAYWLELLSRTGYLDEAGYQSIGSDCVELLKMLTASIKSTRGNG